MRYYPLYVAGGLAAAAAGLVIVSTFRTGPLDEVQRGFRGTAMVQNFDPPVIAAEYKANAIPPYLPQVSGAGVKANVAYKNVQVLGNLSVGQFTRVMASITQWVAPQAGCNYCHVGNNFAVDDKYTKVVARRMLQMTQHINVDWQSHVQNVGVTCYTCHRGNNIPAYIFYNDPGPAHPAGMVEVNQGKNMPAPAAGLASLPYDPFTPYLEHAENIRVASTTALPSGDRQSIKQTDWTYALMMHFATSLGVNCTYCHNTRAFASWAESTPQRVTAWYGIRMVRDLNNEYLESLHGVFPDYRLGPAGDVAKIDCATCHQGVYKPLFGVSMAKDFPELGGVPQPPSKPAITQAVVK